VAAYLQSTTEENLYLCIINGIWGSNTKKLSHWEAGDVLIVYVKRMLAGVFTITGEPFYDETQVWPGDLYPYRIPIRLNKIIRPKDRYSISSRDTRKSLFDHHTRSYGVILVLAARPLDDIPTKLLLDHIEASKTWQNFHPERALEALRAQRLSEYESIAEEIVQETSETSRRDLSPHTEMQFHLAALGRALQYDVWIPKSDQSLRYKGKPLSELSEADLPPLPFNEDVLRIIRNIDVIWLADGHPSQLFEVEHTTSIYSGLLRMSDLVTLIPSLNIGMFICASSDRKDRVVAEVNRPTFSHARIPLAQRCRFIPFDQLAEFMEAQKEYLRHFSTSILEELSESLVRETIGT